MKFPKPGKTRKPGIVIRGEREICRTQYQWAKRKKERWELDGGRCVQCRRPVELKWVMHPDHLKNRKMGGGFRDDRIENLRTKCPECHITKHRGPKPCPPKERL